MSPLRRVAAFAVPVSCIAIAGAMGPADSGGCPVQGVWELVSETNNGTEQPLNGLKQLKIVTQHHWMWVSQAARRDTLPLNTEADTLRRNTITGGAGTYTAAGNTYVEHIDVFSDPTFVGTDWKATCRVEGNVWYHSYPFPQDSTGVPADSIGHYVEVWRKVE